MTENFWEESGFEEPSVRAAKFNSIIKSKTKTHSKGLDRIVIVTDMVKGTNVLDIGCAHHTYDMAKWDKEWLHGNLVGSANSVIGLEYEENEVARMNEAGFNVIYGDASNFDLDGKIFDIVVAGEVLEHLIDPRGLFKSVSRHINTGGKLIITVPNGNSFNYFLQNMLYGYELDGYDHCAFYTPLTLFNMLRKNGYALEELYFVTPPTFKHHSKFIHRVLTSFMHLAERFVSFFRPSLRRQLVLVASKSAAT